MYRNVVFANDEIYHIYNRSVGRESIFTSLFQLKHILETIDYYRYPQILRLSEFKKLKLEAKQLYISNIEKRGPLVEIYVFSFMPNHYHILLKQTHEGGIRQFISVLQNSYAKYFNTKYDRHGSLFQSPFKGRWIESDEQFLHVSRYIHLNHVTSFIITFEKLLDYQYSSFPDYIGNKKRQWLNTDLIIGMIGSKEYYKKFVEDQVDYQRTLASIKNEIIE